MGGSDRFVLDRMRPHALPALFRVPSPTGLKKANWIDAIMMSFNHKAGEDGFGHHPFLLAACEVALSDGSHAAWRLWRRELLAQFEGIHSPAVGSHGDGADGESGVALPPLIQVIVSTLERLGVQPQLVFMLERILLEEERAIDPELFLKAVFK